MIQSFIKAIEESTLILNVSFYFCLRFMKKCKKSNNTYNNLKKGGKKI